MAKKKHKSFEFKPFSRKQKKLLTWWTDKSPYCDYDMVIADGAIRSGKTIACIDSFITWSLYMYDSENFIIAGKSMGALKRNVLQPMFEILTAKGIPFFYHRSEHYIKISNNIYYCFGANNEASQDVLQGLTAAGAYGDEVALFPQTFVEQMIGRCSVDGAKVFLNCNPQGPYHWFKQDYIDKADEKRILYLHFTMDDNLSLAGKVKERFRRMFSGVFFERYILGLWKLAEGIIYDMFSENKHIVDVSKDKFSQYIVGIDYGTSNPCTFGLYGWHLKGPVYLVREYYYDSKKTGRQKTDSEYANDFVKFLDGIHPTAIYLDPSAASFKQELRRRNIFTRDAKNDVISGIRHVAKMLSNGEFFVDKSCKDTIQEFASYTWDPKAQERGEDKPIKQADHAMDRNRYALFSHFGRLRLGILKKPAGY